MNLPEGYLLQILREQFGPRIGADLIALLSVIGRNVIGRIQVANWQLTKARSWQSTGGAGACLVMRRVFSRGRA